MPQMSPMVWMVFPFVVLIMFCVKMTLMEKVLLVDFSEGNVSGSMKFIGW